MIKNEVDFSVRSAPENYVAVDQDVLKDVHDKERGKYLTNGMVETFSGGAAEVDYGEVSYARSIRILQRATRSRRKVLSNMFGAVVEL